VDNAGNLYGTTNAGGTQPDCFACGTVFKLTPPTTPGASWTESVLYSFDGTDGAYPYAGLLFDEEGNLYGTTHTGGVYFQGAVFELSPPEHAVGSWRERVLYSFTGSSDGSSPYGGLVRDRAGTLYGTANLGGAFGYGAVFQLARPKTRGGVWTETVLYSFTGGSDGAGPYAGLVFDQRSRLYGATTIGGNPSCGGGGCGSVFQLTPPATTGGTWSLETLYSFTGGADGAQPDGDLILDNKGRLYGTASTGGPLNSTCSGYCGAVFQLTPPPNSSNGSWTQTTLHGFTGGGDGAAPVAGVLLRKGVLYGTAPSGGDLTNVGVVFQIVP